MTDEHGTPRHFRQPCVANQAARQGGNVTAAQLAACGVSPRTIVRWIADGRLHRRHRGVYAVGHLDPSPHARWSGALLAYDGSVLSRHAAVANHGLGQPPKVVTVAVQKQARRQRGVEPHVSPPFDGDEIVIRHGLRTTSIERTLLDLAAIGEPVERLVAEATARRLTSIAKLGAYLQRRAGARGASRLRHCIEGRQTRSKEEAEFAAWLDERGIPGADFNEPFGPYTLDAYWPGAKLVIEIDTYGTHGTRATFESDRLRDAYTAARGLRTIRVTPKRWRRDGDRLERDIRGALEQL